MIDVRLMDCVFYRNLKKEYPIMDYGKGVCLYDKEGRRYLDLGAGIAVVNIGYGVQEVIEAMKAQAEKSPYIYAGYFTNEPEIRLSKKIIEMSPPGMSKVLFVSGGSEATESALKIARQYHLEKGKESKYRVISRWTSYHGNTLGALSMSGRPSWRDHFIPYLQNFPHIYPPYCYRCPYGRTYPGCDLECAYELERVIKFEGPKYISAFIAEPVIGTSATGVTPPPEYYKIIRTICDQYDVLMISDEVITGLGRTGKNFGIDHWNVSPDIIVTGKGVGGGYTPLAAIVVQEKIYETFLNGSGQHTQGYTYAGNPLSCAVGLAILEYIEKNSLIKCANDRGAYLLKKLEELKDLKIVGDVRGKGLLLGVEFVKDQKTKMPFPKEVMLTNQIVETALENGLILIAGMGGMVDGVLGDHIQITPPFVITESEIDEAVSILEKVIGQVQAKVRV